MTGRRIAREKRTVESMIQIYCRGNHDGKNLCEECRSLIGYSSLRLDKCVFSESKPVCSKCFVHCYEKQKREQMRCVMRYSGPRMIIHHPVLSFLHALDGRTKPHSVGEGSKRNGIR